MNLRNFMASIRWRIIYAVLMIYWPRNYRWQLGISMDAELQRLNSRLSSWTTEHWTLWGALAPANLGARAQVMSGWALAEFMRFLLPIGPLRIPAYWSASKGLRRWPGLKIPRIPVDSAYAVFNEVDRRVQEATDARNEASRKRSAEFRLLLQETHRSDQYRQEANRRLKECYAALGSLLQQWGALIQKALDQQAISLKLEAEAAALMQRLSDAGREVLAAQAKARQHQENRRAALASWSSIPSYPQSVRVRESDDVLKKAIESCERAIGKLSARSRDYDQLQSEIQALRQAASDARIRAVSAVDSIRTLLTAAVTTRESALAHSAALRAPGLVTSAISQVEREAYAERIDAPAMRSRIVQAGLWHLCMVSECPDKHQAADALNAVSMKLQACITEVEANLNQRVHHRFRS